MLGISNGVPRSVPVSSIVPSVVPVAARSKMPLRELPTSITVDVSSAVMTWVYARIPASPASSIEPVSVNVLVIRAVHGISTISLPVFVLPVCA